MPPVSPLYATGCDITISDQMVAPCGKDHFTAMNSSFSPLVAKQLLSGNFATCCLVYIILLQCNSTVLKKVKKSD